MTMLMANGSRLTNTLCLISKTLKPIRSTRSLKPLRWQSGRLGSAICKVSTISLGLLHIKPDLSTKEIDIPSAKVTAETVDDILTYLIKKLSLLCRSICLSIIFLPAVLTCPLALTARGLDYWIQIVMRCSETAGPVFVKVCQWASTRRDMFPSIVCDRLSKLQRNVTPHSWQHTFNILQETYGGRYHEIFIEFDRTPVGSGCCAQVYRAAVQEDDHVVNVAVKVLHPGLDEQFQLDLALMKATARFLTWCLPSLAWLNLESAVNEFGHLMTGQVDLLREAEHLDKFRVDFADHSQINFPRPIRRLCNSHVLVETWAEGTCIRDYTGGDVSPGVQKELANLGVDMLLKMVFKDNFWHGDLHPGNILVTHTPEGKLSLNVLDAGIYGSLSSSDSHLLAQTFSSIVTGDSERVACLFLERSFHECTTKDAFISEMKTLIDSARGVQLTLDRVDVSELLQNLFSILTRHRVRLDAAFSSVVLAIMVLEGLGRSLDPSLDLLTKAAKYIVL